MPNRSIRESWTTDPDRDRLTEGAECFGYRLTLKADDAGRFDADPRVLLANCFPLRIGRLSPKTIEKWLLEWERVGLVQLYTVDGRRYGRFAKWEMEQRIYNLKSKFPQPPADCGKVPQPPENSGSYPISDLRDSINDKSSHATVTGFEQFWSSYPRKQSRGAAEKAWDKLKPSEQLQAQILTAIEQAKTSQQWTNDGGKYIPYASTWLNSKGWLDEYMKTPLSPQKKCEGTTKDEPCQEYAAAGSRFCVTHRAYYAEIAKRKAGIGHENLEGTSGLDQSQQATAVMELCQKIGS